MLDRFGTREQRLTAAHHDVALTVEHAPRVRYGSPTRLRIGARAVRGEAAGAITVRVESGYLDKFIQLSMYPPPADIDARAHVFVLPASGAEKQVLIELEPAHYGPVRGRITATVAQGAAPVEIALEVFIFP